ncbi:MAG: hypothetical protein IPL52_10500 [Flavobacteriales bacterium]|nr:hypothetical protein [Flavobacteriales bacterium]
MTLEEKLAHARVDLSKVLNKFMGRAHKLEHAFKTSRTKAPMQFQEVYTSPNKNNWLVTVRATKGHLNFYTLVWWQYPGVGLEALHVKPDGVTFYLDTHFFQRYRERHAKIPGAVDNLKAFFWRNFDIHVKQLDSLHQGKPAIAGVVPDGLVLGTMRPGDVVSCDTFLSPDDLSEKNTHLLNEVSTAVLVKQMGPQQRQALLRTIEETLAMLDARLEE